MKTSTGSQLTDEHALMIAVGAAYAMASSAAALVVRHRLGAFERFDDMPMVWHVLGHGVLLAVGAYQAELFAWAAPPPRPSDAPAFAALVQAIGRVVEKRLGLRGTAAGAGESAQRRATIIAGLLESTRLPGNALLYSLVPTNETPCPTDPAANRIPAGPASYLEREEEELCIALKRVTGVYTREEAARNRAKVGCGRRVLWYTFLVLVGGVALSALPGGLPFLGAILLAVPFAVLHRAAHRRSTEGAAVFSALMAAYEAVWADECNRLMKAVASASTATAVC